MVFRERVLDLIQQIPMGSVATYGQIAALAGSPRAARQVGGILRGLKDPENVPWQRVVNAQGGLSTWKTGAGELQQALLLAEGIAFDTQGCCNLEKHLWKADPVIHLDF